MIQTTTRLRVARPTDDLEAVARFYRDGLGFTELYRFADHDGFDGVMLGLPGAPYHLEFTRAHGHRAGTRADAPTICWCSIFPMPAQWHEAVARFKRAGYEPVPVVQSVLGSARGHVRGS